MNVTWAFDAEQQRNKSLGCYGMWGPGATPNDIPTLILAGVVVILIGMGMPTPAAIGGTI